MGDTSLTFCASRETDGWSLSCRGRRLLRRLLLAFINLKLVFQPLKVQKWLLVREKFSWHSPSSSTGLEEKSSISIKQQSFDGGSDLR